MARIQKPVISARISLHRVGSTVGSVALLSALAIRARVAARRESGSRTRVSVARSKIVDVSERIVTDSVIPVRSIPVIPSGVLINDINSDMV